MEIGVFKIYTKLFFKISGYFSIKLSWGISILLKEVSLTCIIAVYLIFNFLQVFFQILKNNYVLRNLSWWLLLNSVKVLIVWQFEKIFLNLFSEEKTRRIHWRRNWTILFKVYQKHNWRENLEDHRNSDRSEKELRCVIRE